VFGVSVKDRGAISMAGHGGKAFWFSKQAGQFVTSKYYYDKYPDWVVRWNSGGGMLGACEAQAVRARRHRIEGAQPDTYDDLADCF